MNYARLRDRKHYEDLYDEITVENCRSGERVVNNAFSIMEKKLPRGELKRKRPGWYLLYSQTYFGYVESVAAMRRHNRQETIDKWMERDEQKDKRLANAKLAEHPYCRTCGSDMNLVMKEYLRRRSTGKDEDDILLMFECKSCNKRTAFWQDGTEWEGADKVLCKKCGGEMAITYSKKFGVITTTYKCAKCKHIETETLDINKDDPVEEEPVDPLYELDRKRFVFDEEMEQKFMAKMNHLLRMAKLELDTEDRAEHVDVYDAIKDIKQLKIAQLSDVLKEALEKDGYREFKLGDPELGQQVVIGFSCLDDKSERKEYDSKKGLQKLINKALVDTNWRLMSDGVDYRLGYLNGRLRAYEKEEELKKLVEQRIKDGTLQPSKKDPVQKLVDNDEPKHKYEGMRMREAALVYMDQMYLGSKPAEITLKSGRVKATGIPTITANMNPLFKVFIPMRENDDSVPEFVRTYDFKMGPGEGEIPKVSKDSLGREIRLL